MAATVSEIAAALKVALLAVPGLRVADYIQDNPNPPIAVVGISNVTYHRAFAGGDPSHEYVITIMVGRESERSAQTKLDAFLSWDGPQSIRSAIESDQTLQNVVDTCLVEKGGNVNLVSIGDSNFLTVEFTVTVHI